MSVNKLTTVLWFDGKAEEAAHFYTSVFKDSKIGSRQYFVEDAKQNHGQEAGSLMVIEFEINGNRFAGLNGGPHFKFNEAVSFMVDCEDQAEVDYYWEKLGEGGDERKQMCGWLGDKYGVSWQVIPKVLKEMLADEDRVKAGRVTAAMMGMKKLDIAGLKAAFEGCPGEGLFM
ncbi:3-demethylubiquinone-9 3-methyltransferase [Sodiomyces alkalinus F11]|uniref:3-demethylubiquinone-9 3-methyltransferase n=1 Tax=Sodiomyces alkalinus (strain CBS 110278 / VKM F-3762 / F11) TaxID=1314773 RepID=A0A3N2PYV4_SODAK|nr:3-demethylubiquinone-9 3-methyltransferase [Sodiomyces alkalinus F11]ROT39608.1 3-demethylubiquinone-9 3-methyltransferase [Sodiomyces alkalinus F11]